MTLAAKVVRPILVCLCAFCIFQWADATADSHGNSPSVETTGGAKRPAPAIFTGAQRESDSQCDKNQSILEIREAAERGEAEAQLNLGMHYKQGIGVPKDDVEAVKWYRKAAEQGLDKAQVNLGVCYGGGIGVPKDDVEAVKWYRKAAEQGNAIGQCNLGLCYVEGNGVTKDVVEAVKYFRNAVERGCARAQYNLGICYLNGSGVSKSDSDAVKWFKKAAEQGFVDAEFNLGQSYNEGLGVPKDIVRAIKWWREAAQQGHPNAQYNLGVCWAEGTGIKKDAAEATRCFRDAAEQGFARAQFALGQCYDAGFGLARDIIEAYRWFSLASKTLEQAKRECDRISALMTPEHKAEMQRRTYLPPFRQELSGREEVRVRNPNAFSVTAGLRSSERGINFEVPANGTKSVYVPDGRYEIYFVYSDKPNSLFQGDSFALNGNGVEIQIVQVVNGNYGIRQVK